MIAQVWVFLLAIRQSDILTSWGRQRTWYKMNLFFPTDFVIFIKQSHNSNPLLSDFSKTEIPQLFFFNINNWKAQNIYYF